MLSNINPFYHTFEYAAEQLTTLPNDFTNNLCVTFVESFEKDRRLYNLPSVDELAVVVNFNYGVGNRDIIIRRNGHPQRISEFNAMYDPLHYILMHSYGHQGFQFYIPQCNESSKWISVRDYYAFQLQIREQLNYQYFGRLFHEFIIDMAVKVITNKLQWYQTHQDRFRYEIQSGIADAVENGLNAGNVGTMMILPHHFVGSPRFYRELYLNSLEICRRLGAPTLTLTFTANPNWPEVRRNILDFQDPNDRIDVIVRVFFLKLNKLKKILKDEEYFGPVKSYMHVIEYQKRGMYILLI